MIVIIGAGLTGLGTAYHLGKHPYRLFEQEQRPGGLCRSERVAGFTFDYTGHLLHAREAGVRRLVQRLLPDGLKEITRNAAVHTYDTEVPYPFQANLRGLPEDVLLECLAGFIDACRKKKKTAVTDFKTWVLDTFGPGIARHFFIPYNEKLWVRELRKLTGDWAAWSIPRPTLDDVLRGALGSVNEGMGYNASFWYPRSGGIEALVRSLSSRVNRITTGKRLVSVDMRTRRAVFADGTEVHYERLVSTMPLPDLLEIINDLPARYREAGRRLTAVAVHNINIGIDRPDISRRHWLYFPEKRFPFYRVGFYSNFYCRLAPAGTSSLYIEIAAPSGQRQPYGALRRRALTGLRSCGLLRPGDRIVAEHYAPIRYGYVVYDRHRRRCLGPILAHLKRRGIISAGRYGAWEYSAMQDALRSGREIAALITQAGQTQAEIT